MYNVWIITPRSYYNSIPSTVTISTPSNINPITIGTYMRDLHWYAVQQHVVKTCMKGVVLEEVASDYIHYHRPRSKPVTIETPSEEQLYLYLYGSMVMDGYTMVPSPDGKVHLCSGGAAVYNVTNTTCTCAASTYSKDSTPCKHIHMLRGYELYRSRAMSLRSRALNPA
jgi:hypothetical protein